MQLWGLQGGTLGVCGEAGAAGWRAVFTPRLPEFSVHSRALVSPFKNKNGVLNERLSFRRESVKCGRSDSKFSLCPNLVSWKLKLLD